MALEVGTRLGHYDVTALIGEGGMGQVYQATDTKLNRQVALKILPEAFATDPDRLARFQREAQVLASLNHPGIAAIYGIEESGDTRALVLELVEGPTLADRIAQGPIPVDEALPIAKQIAEALEAAHEAGVIHRDLKPANIKVREDGTVKVLDFGLAKALDTTPQGDPSQSPTLTAAATQMGVILGTAAYMSPEQARGRPTDRRADIWSFGVVLFEMLTGQRAFAGEEVSVTLADVIRADLSWDKLPTDLPPGLATYLRRCLEKEPSQRIQAIGDMRLAMEGAFEAAAQQHELDVGPSVWHRPASLAARVLVLVAAVSFATWYLKPIPAGTADVTRVSITLPATAPFGTASASRDLAVSPDGTRLAYAGAVPSASGFQLYMRPLDQFESTPIAGTEGGEGPFFSAEGEWLGFSVAQTLKRISPLGGLPVTLAESPNRIRGASWGADDQIVFGTVGAGLFRIPGSGGAPVAVTMLDVEHGETGHYLPDVLPGERAVVFTIATGQPRTTGQLAVVDLASGAVTSLGLAGVSARFVSTGHLVYATGDGSVEAVPFDATGRRVTGTPVPVLGSVAIKNPGAATFDLSDTGRLVYVEGGTGGARFERSFVWVDREGGEELLAAPVGPYRHPRVSPDGIHMAVDLADEQSDIWIWDLVREMPLRRLTFDSASDFLPHWMPNGERILFTSDRTGRPSVFARLADGAGDAVRLTEGPFGFLNAVTPDGARILVRTGENGADLHAFPVDGKDAPEVLLNTGFDEQNATLSPDGRWMAYQSNESGRDEIHVRPFPNVTAGHWQLTNGGGTEPLWNTTRNELFYRDGPRLMVVSVQFEPSFSHGPPAMLFEGSYVSGAQRSYDVSPNGQRLLMMKDMAQDGGQRISFVLNWDQELKERVPIP